MGKHYIADERNCPICAAECKTAHAQKAEKQIEINHSHFPPFCSGAVCGIGGQADCRGVTSRLIDETFQEKMLISMTVKSRSSLRAKKPFCIFFIIVTAASKIKMPTAI